MKRQRYLLTVGWIVLLAAMVTATDVRATGASEGWQALAQAQTERQTTMTRVKRWTRARLDAAKARWRKNQQKFSACSTQLAELRKQRRMTVNQQGHFLDDCMRQP
jgi:hypothetical protein